MITHIKQYTYLTLKQQTQAGGISKKLTKNNPLQQGEISTAMSPTQTAPIHCWL